MTSCNILDLKLFLANTRSKGTRTMHTYLRCAVLAFVIISSDSVCWWLKPGPFSSTQHSKERSMRRICPLPSLKKKRPLPSHKRKKSLCPSLGRLPYTFIYWEYALYLPLTQNQSGENCKIRVCNISGEKNSIALVELSWLTWNHAIIIRPVTHWTDCKPWNRSSES